MRERARSLLDRFLEKWQRISTQSCLDGEQCLIIAHMSIHTSRWVNKAGPMLEEGLLPGDVKFADCLVKGDFKVQKKYADHNNL